MEVQRLTAVVPLAIPHMTSETIGTLNLPPEPCFGFGEAKVSDI